MQTNITTYSKELLSFVTPYLKAKYVGRLWLCGSHTLQRLLTSSQVVRSLVFCTKEIKHPNICRSLLLEKSRFNYIKSIVVRNHNYPLSISVELQENVKAIALAAAQFLQQMSRTYGSRLTSLDLHLGNLHKILPEVAEHSSLSLPLFRSLTSLRLCEETITQTLALADSVCVKLFDAKILRHFCALGLRIILPNATNLQTYTYQPPLFGDLITFTSEDKTLRRIRCGTFRIDEMHPEKCRKLVEALDFSVLEHLAIGLTSVPKRNDQLEGLTSLPQYLAISQYLNTLEIGQSELDNVDPSTNDVEFVESVLLLLPKTVTRLGLPAHCVIRAVIKEGALCKLPQQLVVLGYTVDDTCSITRGIRLQNLPNKALFWRQLPRNLVHLGPAYWFYFPSAPFDEDHEIISLPQNIESYVSRSDFALTHVPSRCRSFDIFLSIQGGGQRRLRFLPTPLRCADLTALSVTAPLTTIFLVFDDLRRHDRPSLLRLFLNEAWALPQDYLKSGILESHLGQDSIRAHNLAHFNLQIRSKLGEFKIGGIFKLTKQLHQFQLHIPNNWIDEATSFDDVPRSVRHVHLACDNIKVSHYRMILTHFPKLKSMTLSSSEISPEVDVEIRDMVKKSRHKVEVYLMFHTLRKEQAMVGQVVYLRYPLVILLGFIVILFYPLIAFFFS